MELYIVTLTGTAFELRVSPNDTVMSIKSKIQRYEGIPIGQQHLIWQNNELSDHKSLRDCSIPGGATLRLVLGMRGGPISTFRPPPTAATATIRFTPTLHFASSSSVQKKSDHTGTTNADDLPTSLPLKQTNADPETQKQITLLLVNASDRLELMRAVDSRHRENTPSNGHSTTSLLGSEDSSELPLNTSKGPPIHTNLLSTSSATQSLPFLKSEDSALTCEPQENNQQLPATASEPSVLKATDRQTSPTTIATSASLFTGYVYGRDTYASDTDDCLSSDCGGGSGAAYFLRPPSPEWDNRDLSSTPPITVPPSIDFPFFSGQCDEETIEGDDDSLADLKDSLIYYQSGDVLFGHRRNGTSSSYNWKGPYCDSESPVLTRSKVTEYESLAEKMRQIRSQLSQQKQERMKRRLRQQKDEEDGDHKSIEEKQKTTGIEPSLQPPVNHKSHLPKIRYHGDQGFLAVPLSYHHPYTTSTVQTAASAVDLPTVATEESNASSIENLTALLLPSRRRFLEPDSYYFYHSSHLSHRQNHYNPERLRRGAAPNKTTSETNLDAASIIPGFAGYTGNKGGSFFTHTHNQRQRRFGTVQPPDFSRLSGGVSDRLRDLLDIEDEGDEESGGSSSLPQIYPALVPSSSANASNSATTASNFLRGRSPTIKKAVSSEIPLPPLSPRGNLTRSGDGPSQAATKEEIEKLPKKSPVTLSLLSPSKTRKDVASEPPRRSPSKFKNDRCASCNRRTGIVDSYTCRCERNFCAKHRYAELHACPFDYKGEARRVIRETNPVVTAAKLPKI